MGPEEAAPIRNSAFNPHKGMCVLCALQGGAQDTAPLRYSGFSPQVIFHFLCVAQKSAEETLPFRNLAFDTFVGCIFSVHHKRGHSRYKVFEHQVGLHVLLCTTGDHRGSSLIRDSAFGPHVRLHLLYSPEEGTTEKAPIRN